MNDEGKSAVEMQVTIEGCVEIKKYINIFYLFIWQQPNPATAGTTFSDAKKRDKNERQVRKAKNRKGLKP